MNVKGLVTVLSVLAGVILMSSCGRCVVCDQGKDVEMVDDAAPLFADDLAFLQDNTDVILLREGRAAVAVVADYQGRVMTSSFDLETGPSFGWLNRELIEEGFLPPEEREGKLQNHIHALGGEERFWLGPEGGQFSIFFKPDSPFDFEHWKTPACIDTESYAVKSRNDTEVAFEHECRLVNWSGSRLHVGIERTVRLLSATDVTDRYGIDIGDLSMVAYETENTITNFGKEAWTKESGMISIWLLGMYPPTPGTTVVIPFKSGPEEELGPKVNDAYFGKVPEEYLRVEEDVLFFKGDGTYRAKIGISPARSKDIAGSYDRDSGVLNLVVFKAPQEHPGYVNSMWELQDDPFSGDAINAYNDGAAAPGLDPLGPFYELETSSPAADLKPGESLTHSQTTLHLHGSKAAINRIALETLGVPLTRIEDAF